LPQEPPLELKIEKPIEKEFDFIEALRKIG
jgi:hypothetical protein